MFHSNFLYVINSVLLFLQTANWVPDRVPIRPKSVRFHPSMTTAFESNNGHLTNNISESYNARMKKKLGDHPNLPKFIRKMRKEVAWVEFTWIKKDQENAAKKRRREDQDRFDQREAWEVELKEAISQGITDDDIFGFIDKMVTINRRVKKMKKHKPSYVRRGRGRGRPRGPVRAQAHLPRSPAPTPQRQVRGRGRTRGSL